MWIVNIHIFFREGKFSGRTAGKETENMNIEEKKIAIGIGGVGYIAGLLAKALSACDDGGCTWRQSREHPEKRPGAPQ